MSGFWGLVSASPLFGGITPLKVQLTPGCQIGLGADGGLAWCLSHIWLHLAPRLHLAGLLVSHLAAPGTWPAPGWHTWFACLTPGCQVGLGADGGLGVYLTLLPGCSPGFVGLEALSNCSSSKPGFRIPGSPSVLPISRLFPFSASVTTLSSRVPPVPHTQHNRS